MVVASDLGRYFLMLWLVNMGQVAKLPFSTARMSVDLDGLKHAMWSNFTVSAMVPAGTMLLAWPCALWLIVFCSMSSLTRQRPVRC